MFMRWIEPANLLTTPDPTRLVAHNPPLSLNELTARSLALAGLLQGAQARRAALWFDDAAELACALLACWRAGVTAVLPGDAQPSTCARLNDALDLWLSDTELPAAATCRISSRDWLARPAHPPLPPMHLDPDAAGVELLTSGTSGQPKLITKRWRQLTDEIRSLEQQWPSTESPQAGPAATVLGSVNPHHMYGLPFRVLWPLCCGRAIVRAQLAYPEHMYHASLAHAPCVWISSPALLRRCGDTLDWQALKGRVVQMFSAGGPLPTEISDAFETRLALRPTEIYGSSETGVVASRHGDELWRTLPAVRIGADADQGLWVESPWLNGAREQTADAVELLPTGFRLLGRLDRIIKLEEKRVALPMVERILRGHAYVDNAHVDKRTGAARLTGLIALSSKGLLALRNQGRRHVVEVLQRHLAGHLTPLAVPRSWRFLHQLPRNAQDKLLRPVFDALAGPRPLTPVIRHLSSTEDGQRHYEADIPLDLAYFSGHFPTTPVVPGVAQIGWAIETAQRDLYPDLKFGGIEVLKFQKLLRPGDTAKLTLRWNPSNTKLYFSFTLAGEACSCGRILHQASHDAAV